MSETRKIAAILVLDVVGYSRLAGADEDRTLSRLRGLRSDLIDPAIAAHHGRVVKRTGDGAIVEFRSVVDAVRCAIEVQNGMVERNAGLPQERRIDFRIGIHLGDVVEESDGDLMGDGVNIAARLEGIAEPGAICLSEQAYWQVKGRLELAVTDLGATRLKNIAEPVRAYSLQVGVPAVARPAPEPKLPEPKQRLALTSLVMAIAALLVVIAVGAWYFLVANWPSIVATTSTAPAEAARLSIVVLPFVNLSGDPGQDYLVDALTDELITSIAHIPGSFVIARNTAFTYKGKPVDAKAIGKDLGVRYVLEGSVQPSAAQVRVNAQLINADSGANLWAEQFDTNRADLLQMQNEIVTRLARTLMVQLTDAEAVRLKRTPPANPDAQDLALQCAAAAGNAGYIGKEAEAGYRLCKQALALDPDNGLALIMMSMKFWMPVSENRSADPKGDLTRADELVSRELALHPDSAGGHDVKAGILRDQGRRDDSVAENERALALDPTAMDAYGSLAWTYLKIGQYEKGLELFDKAILLSPRDPALLYWYSGKAEAYFGMKRYDQTIEWERRAIAINTTNLSNYPILISALGWTGREAESREAIQRYVSLFPTGPRTIAEWTAVRDQLVNPDLHYLEFWNRAMEGQRKAGLPQQ
jgi:adenylate cyclase